MNFCRFCGSGNNIISITGDNTSGKRKVYEDENFYIIISVGAIVEGHLLIIPKEHFLNMGQMPTKMMEKLYGLMSEWSNILSSIYNKKVIAFEHGTGISDEVSSASVIHAHTHLVPLEDGILDMIYQSNCSAYKLQNFSELKNISETGSSYLFYQDVNSELYSVKGINLPSQFFRKLISDKYKLGEWNWRKDYKEINVLNTIQTLEKESSLFKSIYKGA